MRGRNGCTACGGSGRGRAPNCRRVDAGRRDTVGGRTARAADAALVPDRGLGTDRDAGAGRALAPAVAGAGRPAGGVRARREPPRPTRLLPPVAGVRGLRAERVGATGVERRADAGRGRARDLDRPAARRDGRCRRGDGRSGGAAPGLWRRHGRRAVEPQPAGGLVGGAPAGGVVGALRRPGAAAGGGAGRQLLRPGPRRLPAPRRRRVADDLDRCRRTSPMLAAGGGGRWGCCWCCGRR